MLRRLFLIIPAFVLLTMSCGSAEKTTAPVSQVIVLPLLPPMNFHLQRTSYELWPFNFLSFPQIDNVEYEFLAEQLLQLQPTKIYIESGITHQHQIEKLYDEYKCVKNQRKNTIGVEYFPFYLRSKRTELKLYNLPANLSTAARLQHLDFLAEIYAKDITSYQKSKAAIDQTKIRKARSYEPLIRQVYKACEMQVALQNYKLYYEQFEAFFPSSVNDSIAQAYKKRIEAKVEFILSTQTEDDISLVFVKPEDLYWIQKMLAYHTNIVQQPEELSKFPDFWYVVKRYTKYVFSVLVGTVQFWVLLSIVLSAFLPFLGYYAYQFVLRSHYFNRLFYKNFNIE